VSATQLPSSAKIVIVGGGIVGSSVAYHLGAMGLTDVLLIERGKLTSGSTWHAAGLVGQLRSSANITQLLGYSVALYDRLEAETGQATGWRRNGGLRLACSAERWTEVRRQATTARSFGLEMQLLSAKEAQDLWPLMQVGDVVGAAFLPTDGQASPSDIAAALAKGARMKGVTIREGVAILGVEIEKGALRAVVTSAGRVHCEKLVICAGQWSRAVGRLAGVNVPLTSIQHQYIITEPMAGVTRGLPTLRDPDRLTYWKEEVGGLVVGGYEPNPRPWLADPLPDTFEFQLLQPDWDHFEPIMELALGRVPALRDVGVKQLINGPESFTPDGNFILGEAPETRNIFVGAGFNAFGIASGGGAGMALAEWVVTGAPPFDLWPADIRRFGRNHLDPDRVRSRTLEAYSKHYAMAWPSEEYLSGRPLRRSPLYDRLMAAGAVFGEKLGWERANWFAEGGEAAEDRYTYERPNWFDAVAREHRAARQAAALFDQTSFAKFRLSGPDAEAVLSEMAANDVRRADGAVVYTQMLNDAGGIEADLTIVRHARDAFSLVTGTGFATRDFHWIRASIPPGANASLVDTTSQTAVLVIMGPKSREILQALTRDDVSNAAFPFATARELVISGAPVLALRITYVGELGYELHVPVDFAASLYDSIRQAGAPHGLRLAGYRAIETLRLEKGYRAWGAEIGPDHSPLVAGLAPFVKLKTTLPFRGRAALEAHCAAPLPRLLAGFTAASDLILLGRETIYRNGERVGWLASGGYGHTVGKAIGYGYVRRAEGVDADFVMSGDYELEVAGERVSAKPFLKPLYDPAGLRVRA
jgi:sarcosine dehydrogenase